MPEIIKKKFGDPFYEASIEVNNLKSGSGLSYWDKTPINIYLKSYKQDYFVTIGNLPFKEFLAVSIK